jgi:hypothetical protein
MLNHIPQRQRDLIYSQIFILLFLNEIKKQQHVLNGRIQLKLMSFKIICAEELFVDYPILITRYEDADAIAEKLLI